MLQVRKNEISLRKWSDGTAHLRTWKGTLVVAFVISSALMVTGEYLRYKGACHESQTDTLDAPLVGVIVPLRLLVEFEAKSLFEFLRFGLSSFVDNL